MISSTVHGGPIGIAASASTSSVRFFVDFNRASVRCGTNSVRSRGRTNACAAPITAECTAASGRRVRHAQPVDRGAPRVRERAGALHLHRCRGDRRRAAPASAPISASGSSTRPKYWIVTCHCSRRVHRNPRRVSAPTSPSIASSTGGRRHRREERAPQRRASRVERLEPHAAAMLSSEIVGELPDPLTVAGQAGGERLRLGRPGSAIANHTVPGGWPSCSSGPATPVAAMPTSAPSTPLRADRHLDRALLAHDVLGRHAEHRLLHLGRVRRDRAAERAARAGHRSPMRAPMSPPVSDSATPSVHPRASSAWSAAYSIVSSSTPKTRSPRIARSSVSSASISARGLLVRARPSRSAARRGPRSRGRGTRSSGWSCASTRWAIISASPDSDCAPRLQRPAHDHRRLAGAGEQVGQHLLGDHQLHLVRARRAPRRSTLPSISARMPGAVPIGFGIASAPDRHVGLAQVVLRHVAQPRVPNSCAMCVDELLAPLELDAHHLGDRLARHVVLRRAEPAAHDDRVRLLEHLARSPRSCAAGCRRPCGAPSCRCRPWRAARRSSSSSCRRSGRAAARCRSRGRQRARVTPGSRGGSRAGRCRCPRRS